MQCRRPPIGMDVGHSGPWRKGIASGVVVLSAYSRAGLSCSNPSPHSVSSAVRSRQRRRDHLEHMRDLSTLGSSHWGDGGDSGLRPSRWRLWSGHRRRPVQGRWPTGARRNSREVEFPSLELKALSHSLNQGGSWRCTVDSLPSAVSSIK